MDTRYFHVYANGDDARNFIICLADYRYEFNLTAVCTYLSGISMVAFSIEDTHPHFIVFGTQDQTMRFKKEFESRTMHHIRSTRNDSDGVLLDLQIDMIDSRDYLLRACAYVIAQATKDGKAVMPYDYKWGTGSMYFRQKGHISIWRLNENETIHSLRKFGDLTVLEKKRIAGRESLPDYWTISDNLVLPENYVDTERFEDIFKTHNCFRTFLSAGRAKEQEFMNSMAQKRGIRVEDTEAWLICRKTCMELFGKETSRWLNTSQRLSLATELKMRYNLCLRQLSTTCRLPESEIEKYIR